MRYFSNVGTNSWSLLMNHVQYGFNELKTPDADFNVPRNKLAVIDSGSDFISLPSSYFNSLEQFIKSVEPTVNRVPSTNSSEIMMIKKPCKDIVLENFVFKVEGK